MIIVTGANGQLGRRVVERLLARTAASGLGLSVRDPSAAAAFAARGVRVRRGDFADASSLAHAFEGASQVLIISGPADPAPHQAAIEAAQTAGARRIVYTSHMGARADSPFFPMPAHAATEQHLRDCGTPFSSLRNGFYASTVKHLLGNALETGELRLPEDGPVSWTTHDDLADAAVVALTGPGTLEGISPPLTAAAAVDFTDVARMASELTGRTITRIVVSDEAWVAAGVARGLPERQARMMLGIFQASRRGDFAAVSPALGELIGRAPVAFRDALGAMLAR